MWNPLCLLHGILMPVVSSWDHHMGHRCTHHNHHLRRRLHHHRTIPIPTTTIITCPHMCLFHNRDQERDQDQDLNQQPQHNNNDGL